MKSLKPHAVKPARKISAPAKKPVAAPAARPAKETVAVKKALPPLHSKPTDWVDKQDVMQCFHLSSRTLQNLRSRKAIIWSRLGKKIYYNLPSFVAVLENNREC